MASGWGAAEPPLTRDQAVAEATRSGVTRRVEQAMLQQGLANTRLAALEHRPTAMAIMQARALAGRGTIKMAICRSCQGTYMVGAVYCPQCAVPVGAARPEQVPGEAAEPVPQEA